MKKNWLFSFAVAVVLSGGMSVYGQSANELTPEVNALVENVSGLYKSQSPDAEKALKNLIKKNGKDQNVLLAIGRKFLENSQFEAAEACAEKLYKDDSKFVPGVMFYGDIYMAKKDFGTAASKYDEAIYYDENLIEAYLKKAKVYKYVNAETALETLQELKAKQADCIEADKELASVYYTMNKVKDAIASYKTYFSKIQSPDLEAQKEYAVLLFLDKQYDASLDMVNKSLAQDAKDISLNRMKFYNLIEENKVEEAKAAKDNLFGQYNDTLYNFSDYMYLGRLQKMEKDYPASVASFEKAISMNGDRVELYKDLSDLYERIQDYDKAIANYKIVIEKLGDKRALTDLLTYGKIYYAAAGAVTDSTEVGLEKKKAYIAEGDTIFADISGRTESHLGCLWRARINSLLDPLNPVDAAKVHYEETLQRLEGKENSKASLECLKYLAFYYMKKDDNENAKKYNDMVLAIDSEDALAKQIQQVIEANTK